MARKDRNIRRRVNLSFDAEMTGEDLGRLLLQLKYGVDNTIGSTLYNVEVISVYGSSIEAIGDNDSSPTMQIEKKKVYTFEKVIEIKLHTDFSYVWNWTCMRKCFENGSLMWEKFDSTGSISYNESDNSIECLLGKIHSVPVNLPMGLSLATLTLLETSAATR